MSKVPEVENTTPKEYEPYENDLKVAKVRLEKKTILHLKPLYDPMLRRRPGEHRRVLKIFTWHYRRGKFQVDSVRKRR